MKDKFLYNLLGTIFDKGLIFFVSFFLTRFIAVEVFGLWSLFLQLVIIYNSLTFGPLFNIFSRSFVQDGKIKLYHFKVLLNLILLTSLISWYFFQDLNLISIQVLTLIFFGLYNYLVIYFRFSNLDKKYFRVSIIRFIIFITLIFFGLHCNFNTIYVIIISFLLSNMLVVLPFVRFIQFNKDKQFSKFEFFTLIIYGLLTSLSSGLDKLLIGSLQNNSLLGLYSYTIALTTASNLIVEVFKKSIVPLMFKNYRETGKLSLQTKKMRLKIIVFLFLTQTITPFILFYILKYFDFVNRDYINIDSFFMILFIQAFAFSLYSVYHFINPYFIYLKKSSMMSFSMIGGIILYIVLFYMDENHDIIQLSLYKSVLLILPTGFLGVISLKMHYKKNE